MSGVIYDRIGIDYANLRRADPRIATLIEQALGSADTVLNVGAGAGSYEPVDRRVTAVEPSLTMIQQRAPDAAPAIQATADDLPFADASFDATMAILTIHHWPDQQAGLREIRRVTRGPIVLLTFDPASRPWLTDYFPQLVLLDEAQMPAMSDYARWLGPVRIVPVPIPHDAATGPVCVLAPAAAYLDPRIRSGSSSFWKMSDVDNGLARLSSDLDSGDWHRRYGDLLTQDSYDAGYRLVVAG